MILVTVPGAHLHLQAPGRMNTPTAMAAPHFFSSADSQAGDGTDIAQAKAELRARAKALRAKLAPSAGLAVARHVLSLGVVAPGMCVAGVWPLPGELDLRPLWFALHAQGHRVALPETTPRGQALRFRLWHPEVSMITERFGTQRPDGAECVPDLICVPLLAFDAAGNRLGYGGGYYDRTLAALPAALALGLGYSALQVERVPTGPHDCRLARIVTERGLAVDLA